MKHVIKQRERERRENVLGSSYKYLLLLKCFNLYSKAAWICKVNIIKGNYVFRKGNYVFRPVYVCGWFDLRCYSKFPPYVLRHNQSSMLLCMYKEMLHTDFSTCTFFFWSRSQNCEKKNTTTSFVISVCPSVFPQVCLKQLGSQWTYFH
jgi:hypothetical protein